MRYVPVAATVVTALITAVLSEAQQPPPPKPLAFTNVTVVDVASGRLVPKQTVVVSGNRLSTVGPASKVRVPAGATIVDATNKYLIPGLWDMHIHLRSAPERIYSLLVANGVTGVRQMSDVAPPELRRAIVAGERPGPRILVAKDIEGGTVEASRQNIDKAKAAGIDLVKVHDVDGMDREHYLGIAAYARETGIPFVGHLPNTITEIEASNAGQRTVEHFNEIHCWWPDGERMLRRTRQPSTYPSPDSAASGRCAEVARTFARNGTWLVPTLVVTELATPKPLDHPEYWPRSRRSALQTQRERNCCPSDPTPERGREVIPLLHRFGIPILAGTDAVMSLGILHGFSLHDELGLLVEGGLSPVEALRAATLNPAKFLNATDSLGSVAAGKVADLVLLDADPLADIGNTRKIRGVVVNGHYHDRAGLDAILAEVAKKAEES